MQHQMLPRSNIIRAALWFGGTWFAATIALLTVVQHIDEDSGYASLQSLLLGIAFIAVVAGAIAFPFAFFTFYWFGVYRRASDAA